MMLDALGVTISHSRKVNCYDYGIVIIFSSKSRIEKYIYWYNYNRLQEILKGMTSIFHRNHTFLFSMFLFSVYLT